MRPARTTQLIGAGAVLVGLATHGRATVMATLLCLGIHLADARRIALVVLIALVAGATVGLRVDLLPPAGP